MREETKQLAIALDNWATKLIDEIAEARLKEAPKAESSTPEAAKPKGSKKPAARSATSGPKISVASRSDVQKLIAPPQLHQAANDPEQTNDYQILWNRFKTAPFTPKQARVAFKNEPTETEMIKILLWLEKEGLARDMGGDQWMMEKVYGNQR